MKHSALFSLPFVLAACAAEAPPDDAAPPPDQQFTDCIDGDAALLIGQSASAATLTHAGPVRVIPDGSVVTQDYDTKRLNLVTDPDGIVLRAYCG